MCGGLIHTDPWPTCLTGVNPGSQVISEGQVLASSANS